MYYHHKNSTTYVSQNYSTKEWEIITGEGCGVYWDSIPVEEIAQINGCPSYISDTDEEDEDIHSKIITYDGEEYYALDSPDIIQGLIQFAHDTPEMQNYKLAIQVLADIKRIMGYLTEDKHSSIKDFQRGLIRQEQYKLNEILDRATKKDFAE